MNTDFRQIWNFDVTRWAGLELSVILMPDGGKIRYVSDTLHRYTNIGKAETFKVAFRAWNKKYRLQRVNCIVLSKTVIKR